MSAVPKKKLCWNCEGNIAPEIDNCRYCGVYVHPLDSDDESWNPNYQPTENKTEEIPTPLYQMNDSFSIGEEFQEKAKNNESVTVSHYSLSDLITRLKQDLFPILFLMMGSVFFLFGIVVILFSQNGTFTLQWKSDSGFYFLLFAFPLLLLGWKFLQNMCIESEE